MRLRKSGQRAGCLYFIYFRVSLFSTSCGANSPPVAAGALALRAGGFCFQEGVGAIRMKI